MKCSLCPNPINPDGPYWVQFLPKSQDSERQGFKFHQACLARRLAEDTLSAESALETENHLAQLQESPDRSIRRIK